MSRETRTRDSIYRSPTGEKAIRSWCLGQLAEWPVPHERMKITANNAQTHVVIAGSGATTVVFVPGTNFNAATSLPIATALVEAGYRVVLPDVPGQPGLSSAQRGLSGDRLSSYGAWLSEVTEQAPLGSAIVMGHSFGAAIAMSSASSRIERLVLVSPGGLMRLRLTPRLLAAWLPWSVRPAPTHSARLLQVMHAPGRQPRAELVEWMTLVARHVRSSRDPGAADLPAQAAPRLVVSGEKDVFLPPRKLAPAVRRKLGTDLGVIAGAGHLVVDEHPVYLAALVRGAF